MNPETTIPSSTLRGIELHQAPRRHWHLSPRCLWRPNKKGTCPIVQPAHCGLAFPADNISIGTHKYAFCWCSFLTWKFCLVFQLYHLEMSQCNGRPIIVAWHGSNRSGHILKRALCGIPGQKAVRQTKNSTLWQPISKKKEMIKWTATSL